MARINLGDRAKDIVTGFIGTVTGKASYLTGCDQYIITPDSTEGKLNDSGWFDENRVEVLSRKAVNLKPTKKNKVGGPAPSARSQNVAGGMRRG